MCRGRILTLNQNVTVVDTNNDPTFSRKIVIVQWIARRMHVINEKTSRLELLHDAFSYIPSYMSFLFHSLVLFANNFGFNSSDTFSPFSRAPVDFIWILIPLATSVTCDLTLVESLVCRWVCSNCAVVELFKIVVQGGESSLFESVETLCFLSNFPQITA